MKAKKRSVSSRKPKKAKAPKKKAVKKSVKKKTAAPKKKKAVKAAKPVKRPGIAPKLPFEGKLVGRVTHYFPHVNAAVIKLEKGPVRMGDTLYFKGHTSDFKQRVDSMQVDHKPIEQAAAGDEIGLQVKQRVREHDLVYKV